MKIYQPLATPKNGKYPFFAGSPLSLPLFCPIFAERHSSTNALAYLKLKTIHPVKIKFLISSG